MKSSTLAARDKWLLVYVEPGCRPCEDVLRVFNREPQLTDLPQKLTIIVGGINQAGAKHFAEKYPWIGEACWYADPTRQAAAALKPRGTPVVYGIQQGNIAWTLDGALADNDKLDSILMTWYGE